MPTKPVSLPAKTPPRLLFVCKNRFQEYDHTSPSTNWNNARSTGLRNSVRYIVEMLIELGFHAKEVVVTDNNDIDREVASYKPTHCIIEALWVVPEKFDVLKKLHPNVKWIVRLHSEIPFLATEGVAIEWTKGYVARGVTVAANSDRLLADLEVVIDAPVIYLPNYYVFEANPNVAVKRSVAEIKKDGAIDIGCFGAMRPMKNVILQAAAAIQFASVMRIPLRFHTNTERVDFGGDPILKNLRAMFESYPNAVLVEHPWLEHSEFLKLAATMDIGMQVSFTETFNIVAADLTSVGIPVVTSPEVRWGAKMLFADPTSMHSMFGTLQRAWNYGRGKMGLWRSSYSGLRAHNATVVKVWQAYL